MPKAVSEKVQSTGKGRKAGRPRDELLTRNVLKVALEVYVDLGWSGFNLDVVAKRAGAGKAALYARWKGREALFYDVVVDVYPKFETSGGTLRDNLIELGRHVLDAHTDQVRSAVLWARLRTDLKTYGGIFEKIDREIIQDRLNVYRAIVKHAVATGELSNTGSAMIMIDMFSGGLINYVLYSPTIAEPMLNHGKDELIERFALGALAAAKGLSTTRT